MTAIIIWTGTLLTLAWLCVTDPQGWQDDTGFHYGKELRQ
jgi:hypothetical protein